MEAGVSHHTGSTSRFHDCSLLLLQFLVVADDSEEYNIRFDKSKINHNDISTGCHPTALNYGPLLFVLSEQESALVYNLHSCYLLCSEVRTFLQTFSVTPIKFNRETLWPNKSMFRPWISPKIGISGCFCYYYPTACQGSSAWRATFTCRDLFYIKDNPPATHYRNTLKHPFRKNK